MLPQPSLPRRRAMLLLAFCTLCWSIATLQGGGIVIAVLVANALLARPDVVADERAAVV